MELDWLKRWSLYSPNAVALQDLDSPRQFTYAQSYQWANQLAYFFQQEYDIQAGDRVAFFSTNEIEMVLSFFALQRLGAIMVPINFRLMAPEVDYIVGDCQPKLLIYQEQFAGVVNQLSNLKTESLSFDGESGLKTIFSQEDFSGVTIDMRAQWEGPCLILYTSGTTGFPKGVMITPKMLFWNSVNTSLRLNISQSDVVINFLPLFHTGGWNVLTTPVLHRGGKVLFLKKFEPEKILEVCEKERLTILFGVPTTMDMMVRTEAFSHVDLSSVRYAIVGGEPMPEPLIQTWAEKGIPVRQGYGLTEFGPNVFSLNEEQALTKKGSIGFPNFYIDVKVVNNEGLEVGPDQVGELLLKGPMAMKGYWHKPEETAKTLKNGWLHTGDLVRKDKEGYFYVVGRKKDMFISGGENVYPAEVERLLHSHQSVQEVAVIGVPDDKWGEVGKAFVVAKKGFDVKPQELQSFCQGKIAKFKIPQHFQLIEELPKGDSGKILKRALYNLQ
ncbi:MAG: o-succinylbenzoate--CoA ligase [Bdellovibrionales bacterium]|nr:o-succinylbenzoate--CoA ligase [Bdellovibrionales bacterium]